MRHLDWVNPASVFELGGLSTLLYKPDEPEMPDEVRDFIESYDDADVESSVVKPSSSVDEENDD